MKRIDIGVLSLYKQHYKDRFPQSMECEYSCWGYYDGMSITSCEIPNEPLQPIQSESPIGKLWYMTAKKRTESTDGNRSIQDIGIFRCIPNDEKAAEFWEIVGRVPYMAVGFIQREKKGDGTDRDLRQWIDEEEALNNRNEDPKQTDPVKRTLGYYTYDNADLVALMCSNSLQALNEMVRKIEDDPRIRYFHSVFCVSEEYLGQWAENGAVADTTECDCHLEERIKQVGFRLAFDGSEDLRKKIGSQIAAHVDKYHFTTGEGTKPVPKYEGTAGHESAIFKIADCDVRGLLTFILPKELGTHQNPLYEHGLYNLQTEFCFLTDEEAYSSEIPEKAGGADERCCCSTWLLDYKARAEAALNNRAESDYATYMGMMRTLNSLAQYEQFGMSRDVFWLIYPSCRMFNERVKQVYDEIQNMPDTPDVKIKREKKRIQMLNAMSKYMGSVNSVLYHTIHADQMFLMLPGYSGSAYSLPLKLQLFYLQFLQAVIQLLNDGEHHYESIITPQLEIRPETEAIMPQGDSDDALIRIKLSQRSLSFPESLMPILCHEAAHYSGHGIRCRCERARCLCGSMASAMSTALVFRLSSMGAENLRADENDADPIKELRQQLSKKISTSLWNSLENEKETCGADDHFWYADVLCSELIYQVRYLLSQYDSVVQPVIDAFFDVRYQKARSEKNSDTFREKNRKLGEAQALIRSNYRGLVAGDYLTILTEYLVRLYKELFSDLAAIELLQLQQEGYDNCFIASEGRKTDYEPGMHRLRKELLYKVCYAEEASAEQKESPHVQGGADEETELFGDDFVDIMVEDGNILGGAELYLKACREKLEGRMKLVPERNQFLRQMYELFQRRTESPEMSGTGNNPTGEEIYLKMQECSGEYIHTCENERTALLTVTN